jgi:hypothetical protein
MNKLSRVVTGLAVTGSLLFGAYDYHHNKQPITVEYQEMHDLYYKYNFALGCNTYGFTPTKTIKEAESGNTVAEPGGCNEERAEAWADYGVVFAARRGSTGCGVQRRRNDTARHPKCTSAWKSV